MNIDFVDIRKIWENIYSSWTFISFCFLTEIYIFTLDLGETQFMLHSYIRIEVFPRGSTTATADDSQMCMEEMICVFFCESVFFISFLFDIFCLFCFVGIFFCFLTQNTQRYSVFFVGKKNVTFYRHTRTHLKYSSLLG